MFGFFSPILYRTLQNQVKFTNLSIKIFSISTMNIEKLSDFQPL